MVATAGARLRPGGTTSAVESALKQEVLAEVVGTLGRLLERLQHRLAELAAFEAEAEAEPDPRRQARHQALLDAAAEALWHVIVQRDLMGLRQHESFLREWRVPARVRVRMGVCPAAPRDPPPRRRSP